MKQLFSMFFSFLFVTVFTSNLIPIEVNASLKAPSKGSTQKSSKDSWSTIRELSALEGKNPIKIAPKSYESEIEYLSESHRHFINEINKSMADYDYNDIYTLEKKDLNWHYVKGGISVGLKNKDFHLEDRTYKFYNFEIPESLTIGEKTYPVVAIKDKGFYNCNVLKKIYIPKTIRKIGAQAFNCCKELFAVHIKGELNYIGHFAFSDCPALRDICFYANVKKIGESIFKGSKRLSEVYFHGDDDVNSVNTLFNDSNCKRVYVSSEYKFDYFAGLKAIKYF